MIVFSPVFEFASCELDFQSLGSGALSPRGCSISFLHRRARNLFQTALEGRCDWNITGMICELLPPESVPLPCRTSSKFLEAPESSDCIIDIYRVHLRPIFSGGGSKDDDERKQAMTAKELSVQYYSMQSSFVVFRHHVPPQEAVVGTRSFGGPRGGDRGSDRELEAGTS